MNIIDELHHRLSSKTRIRSLFKDANVRDLEKILSRLNDVYAEKLEVRVAEEEQRQKKVDKIKAIQKEMASLGLTLSDFDALDETGKGSRVGKGAVDGRKRRNVSKHTFEYKTVSGDAIKWYGSTTGRLPKGFQDYLEKTGKKRTDCIADSE
ncbi:hypothetical protein ACH42_16200 [Endozoicomonas sp. (ex Bugula neritina AB1)]|nr:hypothetical protein ACH42_16200 [Endozoicomonas sp. (ex Bugula neritina AB1)]